MRDEETGSWWQQVSGTAIQGPLAGKSLEPIAWDEVTFALWKEENPNGSVLLPDSAASASYASANWEEEIARMPTVTPADSTDALKPRDLVLGVRAGTAATAYPWEEVVARNPIVDVVGETPILLLLHSDGRSVRCFDRRVDGRTLELFLEPDSAPPVLVDSETGSRWDFSGAATSGPLAGKRLSQVQFLKDFWFDWVQYNPTTSIFAAH